jgi:hypothetical protein
MNTHPITLEQRISDALQPDTVITSADIAALIEETDVGIAKAEQERAVDRTLALDPKAARQRSRTRPSPRIDYACCCRNCRYATSKLARRRAWRNMGPKRKSLTRRVFNWPKNGAKLVLLP